MALRTVFLRLPAPFANQQILATPEDTLISLLPPQLANKDVYLRASTVVLEDDACLADVASGSRHPLTIDVCVRLRGGKGGFGTNLRAAGGRMSMNKAQNTDACRDLSGRRLSTLKEAQRQADLIESVDTLRAQATAESKAKLEALERSLGVSHDPESSTAGSKRIADVDVEEIARKKYRFEDNKYLEESREIKDSVRSAVSAAMLLKKKKKAKTDGEASALPATAPSGAKVGASAAKKAEKDKAAMPPPQAIASVSASVA